MKKLLLIVSLVFLSVHLYAERVDENTALKVANTIVKDAKFDVMATRSYSNFYIFSSENSFVIVAADDRVKPIIGYSDSNPFVLNENMTNVNYWLGKVNNEIQYVVDNDIKATEEIENEWKTLLAGNSLAPKSRATVEPLLTTKWNQGEPFNNMCPTYGSERTVTGCVATAMAQIMNYWEWPKTGTGSHSYTSTAISSTHNVNFANTTYDWDNMKDTYNSYTATEANAVATLMYHVGVSVDMDYNVSSAGGSGAYSNCVHDALKTYFDYNPDITNVINYNGGYYYHDKEGYLHSISGFTAEKWVTSIKDELNNERPVYYSGSGDGGGHAFVCDGYDASDNFHFNWGWGGSCDGYYPIGSLNPGTGGIGSGTVGEFNDQNFIILGFEPNPANYVADAYVFVGEGSWNTPSNWEGLDGNTLTTLPDFSTQKVVIKGNAVIGNEIEAVVANLEIKSSGTLTIQNGGSLTVNDKATNTKYDALIIEEGAQVFVNNEDVAATFKKSISNPDTWAIDHDKGWQFIASPLKNADIANFVPSTGDYDLFKYNGDDIEDLQWQNHKDYGGGALTTYTYNFDTGFDGWTTIDGDGDGYTFFHSDESATYTKYDFASNNFYNEGIVGGALRYDAGSEKYYLLPNVNNYLVAPEKVHVVDGAKVTVTLGSTLWNGNAENIGVAVSTDGNTFTRIAEYTTPTTYNTFNTYTADLSAYAGQDVWVAIHHYTASISNVSFFMIDNITIKAAAHDFEESFQQGRGYLASYETETTANIKGYIPTETSFNFPLTYNADNRWSNFHLLGNPFSFDINWDDFAKTGVYDGIARMTTEGTYKYDATSDIKVGEGFMVMTNGTSPSLTYGTRAYNESYDNISVVASGVEGSDNVVLHFNGEENEGFPKLDNINENAANVFVLRNGNRYGICSYDEDVTEIPLYFDAKEMGSYSLAIETDGRFDNVYLYDKMTNETVDMLAEGEYRFTSTADENPNRFVIRFNRDNDNITSDNFVYQSEDNLYVNAEGTIQIIDVMGRIVYSSDVENDNNVINVSHLNKATYFVRNINENQVRIQKIVIL